MRRASGRRGMPVRSYYERWDPTLNKSAAEVSSVQSLDQFGGNQFRFKTPTTGLTIRLSAILAFDG